MVTSRTLVMALAASALPTAVVGASFGSLSTFQKPMEAPDCDGSGIVGPDGHCNGDGFLDNPGRHGGHSDKDREGFVFDNPSTNCKFVSQPKIWDSFKTLEKDMSKLFTLINKDVDFTIVGHHPGAGHYTDLLHFFVNALRRVSVCFSDHPEEFRIHPQGIHGGCDSAWSVQEIQFLGRMNSGEPFDIVNTWVTKWNKDTHQMDQIRTYIDSARVMELLHKNEAWWNASTYTDHKLYLPGPTGMPDLDQLKSLMGYPDGRKYDDL